MKKCLLCQGNLKAITIQPAFAGVTSDCKPWPTMGQIAICQNCGHVQKIMDAVWQKNIQKIYENYSVFSKINGDDQKYFNQDKEGISRALFMVKRIIKTLKLPECGKLLDFGCGTGSFLRYFNTERPKWNLFGLETAKQFREPVAKLNGVREVFDCLASLKLSREKFDLISLNDVLEHLPNPVEVLQKLAAHLSPQGIIFAHSPDFSKNPFDLPVIDHCSHFTRSSIDYTLFLAGLKATDITDTTDTNITVPWLDKETGFMAQLAPKKMPGPIPTQPGNKISAGVINEVHNTLNRQIIWLKNFLYKATEQTDRQTDRQTFAILGTANAGVWLAKSLMQAGRRIDLFVEEDKARQGIGVLGLSVLPFCELKAETKIFLPFVYDMAQKIKARLANTYPNLIFITPDAPAR